MISVGSSFYSSLATTPSSFFCCPLHNLSLRAQTNESNVFEVNEGVAVTVIPGKGHLTRTQRTNLQSQFKKADEGLRVIGCPLNCL